MVLNQCIVKGCHSSSSDSNLEAGSGGHLHPIPPHVIEDTQLERKWIELTKVRIKNDRDFLTFVLPFVQLINNSL